MGGRGWGEVRGGYLGLWHHNGLRGDARDGRDLELAQVLAVAVQDDRAQPGGGHGGRSAKEI